MPIGRRKRGCISAPPLCHPLARSLSSLCHPLSIPISLSTPIFSLDITSPSTSHHHLTSSYRSLSLPHQPTRGEPRKAHLSSIAKYTGKGNYLGEIDRAFPWLGWGIGGRSQEISKQCGRINERTCAWVRKLSR
ncbi:uncharacterized protein LAJ45_04618 [Morchella importuna]|uniref:uncharacterized protein n=1 Tax=Morchella importuna TaxID=1174673 RepID=UPI001E8E3FB6|nr:uncharacterized protein LAJ45_04618 [Morchella importuna]KAH8151413.1 hypothetical protein LAJ45_04618 [Morchella importuna]